MIDLRYWLTPNGHKVAMLLEEAGVAYRISPVDISAGDQFKPDFLAFSPNNRMPAIIDHAPFDGGDPVTVFESGAILVCLRALEATMGRTLDPLRFRANVYVDGLPAWSEFDLIERSLLIGPVPVRAVRRTRRCPATNVNPATAERDTDVPRALREHLGRPDLGIYLEVDGDGTLDAGDAVRMTA